jgi:glutathione S-transferase
MRQLGAKATRHDCRTMNQLTFENPVFASYALAAGLLILKMMSQGWITVFRMIKVNAGFRYPEDARKSLANPNPSPDQLLPNEYVERSRRIHANDLENIPLFLIAGLLYVCTSPSLWLAAGLFAIYVVSRLAHFLVLLTHRSHEVRALFWTIGSVVVYFMAGAVIWHALAR